MKRYLMGCGIVLGLGALAGLAYLAWQFWLVVVELDPAALAAWAILATLIIPAGALFAFSMGRREGWAMVEGIKHGTTQVTAAADTVIGQRVTATRELRAARGVPARSGVAFNVFTPGASGPAYFGGTGYPAAPTISPKALPPGNDVVDV